ncbi:FAD/NAD(P)-binding domain-containing protein [Yamadazyma tenuis ATCC 10573]|uniref:FAD/NAD(P)-binding domain-containing protein n=1 Tax=Candida tenuis (strain ATCC 10573 / BCRC 21748 / CBS 615 / JCM 9827 / NBRC 10315 / NRRL Y-1498 / VKM Y-70) TaxID=590646 RepID=G3AXH7_CANTC|nr:FAD/NAD(P)-binding domain-containing protein [Yamadazyma tenuis ATCC 10573]EGV66383.1 FAD/NAD(P)-binding domain-containing protein [Yamadazyma tenuis ATCC 10573]
MVDSVLIVGCGVMGLSTALHLAKKGYQVKAIDAYPVPSPWSAACDYNKIIRTEYAELVYTKMSLEAWELWRNDPLYKDVYKECGRVLVTPPSHQGRKKFEAVGIANLQSLGGGQRIEYKKGGKALAKQFKFLKYNTMSEQSEYKWNPETGIGIAGKSLKAVYLAAKELGVEFVFGEAGRAVEIKTEGGIDTVFTADGSRYSADQIVIASGASAGSLLDLKQQQSATGLFVTHIQLTEKEYQKYKDIPVVFDSDLGYFFPPDEDTRILKIALPGSGAQNYVRSNFRDETRSLPRYKNQHPEDTMPTECMVIAKQLLATYIPELAYLSTIRPVGLPIPSIRTLL